MSKSKVVLGVVVAVVVIGGLAWWSMGQQGGGSPAGISQNNPGAAAPQPAPAPAQQQVTAQSATNASMNQDLSSMDNQMKGLSSDSASVDQSMNDQPIPQN